MAMRARGVRHQARTSSRGARFALAGLVALALSVATLHTTAFAHKILSTTPQPASGVVGTTELGDQAQVHADNTRDVLFSLWAPGTCGQTDAQPVFTDTEE